MAVVKCRPLTDRSTWRDGDPQTTSHSQLARVAEGVGIIVLGVLIALGAEQSADPFAVGMNDQQFFVIRSRDQGQGLVLVGHWFDDLTHTSGP